MFDHNCSSVIQSNILLTDNWNRNKSIKKTVLDYDAFFAGNVWAQEWAQTYNMTVPHPNKASVDVSPTMVAQVSSVAVKVFYVEK